MGKWFIEAFLVFVGYTAAYTLTLGFVYPMQKILLPENSLMASLLFLPHGVRAIAFFLFGIRATLYLLPAHYAMWYITVHGADIGSHETCLMLLKKQRTIRSEECVI